MVTRLQAGRTGFGSRQGCFLFAVSSRPVVGPTQSPAQWVPRTFSLGGKAAGARSWPHISI